jgi:tRNA(fMet)-specific endonuclease VapC
MSFLLDTDTCSAHLRRPSGLIHRFVQHAGRLHIPTVVLGELYAWAHFRQHPSGLLTSIEEKLLADVQVLPYDNRCAWEFGRLRGTLRRQGISVETADLMIASVALAHNVTLVTHNTADFRNIPGLRLDDWLTR